MLKDQRRAEPARVPSAAPRMLDAAGLSLAALAGRVRRLGGWKRRTTALLAGAASVLAMAPFFAWPVLWVTLPVLVWLIDGATCRACARSEPFYRRGQVAAAEVGFWFGFGYLLAGLYWIGAAFLVEAETFAVLLPFAVTLLPAGLALIYGAAAGFAACLWRKGAERVLVLALALSAGEWLRGHALSGFPWNVLGYALTFPLPLMQSAAYLGIYALTLATVLIFGLPAVLCADAPAGRPGRAQRAAAPLIGILPLLIAALLGELRLSLASLATLPGAKLRIVQPSVPQREKWRPESQARIFLDHLALSSTNAAGQEDAAASITHLVWPEAAMPFLVLDHAEARAAIARMLPEGAMLITGALRAEPAAGGRRLFNSILVFAEGGAVVARYDKIHLVPFGEYLPMQGLLEAMGLRQLTQLRGGFASGRSPRPPLKVPGLPDAVPLICYEAVFPGAIVASEKRPQFMLNVTNDGWFGDSTGPRQHFHQARVRAVEEGMALIRAANNGISAVVDSYGRIIDRLDLNVRGVIDTALPANLPPPPYARWGDGIFLLLWLAAAAALALQRRFRPRLRTARGRGSTP